MNAAMDLCAGRLGQLLRRMLTTWEGLPEGCAEEEIARWLPLHPGEGIAHFGSESVEYRFRVAEAIGFAEPLRLHFRDHLLCLVRTGLWSTDRAECGRLLENLGEPPDRLSLVFGMGVIAEGEYVYAARGLTLGVMPGTGLIASMAVYPPCSVNVYRRCFHDSGPVREFAAQRQW